MNNYELYVYAGDLPSQFTSCSEQEAPCANRHNTKNCKTYVWNADECSTCVNGATPLDGRCDHTSAASSTVVKFYDVTEDKEHDITKFTALDNKLNNFGDKITKYNGYKTNSTQIIIVSGEFNNVADITGAYNVHNGSLKGGIGVIEIVRDKESPTTITCAVKGLVGGNNYDGSEVIINLDVNDTDFDGKHSFIAGMGKEVGTYKADDSDEINGIDLGSAEYGQHNADLINAGKVDISSGGSAQVYGMLGLRHADNVANHSENHELSDFINASTGKIDISAPNAKEIYGIRVNNMINKTGLSGKFSNVTNDGTINISGGSNVYGIAAKNTNIFNNGSININAVGDNVYGIHAERSNVENGGNITVNSGGGNTYGIYAINGSTIKNSGVITINNNEFSGNFADGKSIYVDSTSYILNANTIISHTSFDTRSLGGRRYCDEKRHSNRTVVRTGFDYEWGKDVELSASLLSNIDGEYQTDAVCDVKYHF
ncbi:MAG: hypothetical protein II830_02530 [Alphaproteobacteria bacterium]|nr:hypothetical protein [Alphaproteobacteria bacterium]